MTRFARWSCAGAVGALLLLPKPSLAASFCKNDPKHDRVRDVYYDSWAWRHVGDDFYSHDDFNEALRFFEHAESICHMTDTVLYQARALKKLGKLLDAARKYQQIERETIDPEADVTVGGIYSSAKELARKEYQDFVRTIPTLTLNVTGDRPTDGLIVKVDGALTAWGLPLQLDPGSHLVTTTMFGISSQKTVDLLAGARVEQPIVVTSQPPEAPSTPPAESTTRKGKLVIGFDLSALSVVYVASYKLRYRGDTRFRSPKYTGPCGSPFTECVFAPHDGEYSWIWGSGFGARMFLGGVVTERLHLGVVVNGAMEFSRGTGWLIAGGPSLSYQSYPQNDHDNVLMRISPSLLLGGAQAGDNFPGVKLTLPYVGAGTLGGGYARVTTGPAVGGALRLDLGRAGKTISGSGGLDVTFLVGLDGKSTAWGFSIFSAGFRSY